MLLKELLLNPSEGLDYLERLVNDGSKSGFTNVHTTSKETCPLFCESFVAKKLFCKKEEVFTYGSLPSFCQSDDKSDWIYFHPDWINQKRFNYLKILNGETVIPTSSSRTVRVIKTQYYIKMSYPGELGRLVRNLDKCHLLSSIENTAILKKIKESPDSPEKFEYMPEIGGKILLDKDNSLGYVIRKIPEAVRNLIIIPGFSLFSKDKNHQDDLFLLIQILELKSDKKNWFLHELCYPLIDIFFYCAFNEGIILEMHSQNVLFAFDQYFNLIKIIIRDLESADKDLTIRFENKKTIEFDSYPYKCIKKSDDDYYKRHSLMYDHKLCEYLIDPLVDCISKYYNIHAISLRNKIKEYVIIKYGKTIRGFFPKDKCWYKYPNTEIDRSTKFRPFISYENPPYR